MTTLWKNLANRLGAGGTAEMRKTLLKRYYEAAETWFNIIVNYFRLPIDGPRIS